tara:strand:- start:1278 stop:2069 length:792 start_codon:yes stop_codon:yes gene_type:complete
MAMFKPPLDLSEARILVVNDDGIRAPGIKVLERIAKTFTKDVWIFAPEKEESGAGHSLSLNKAIKVSKLGPRGFAVGGRPTDCVMLALGDYLSDRRPDLVLSGINRGGNLEDNFTYSGTGVGALEATLLSLPAIALSQAMAYDKPQFRTAERHACGVIETLLALEWARDVFRHVNFPDVSPETVSGVSMVPQGRRKSGYNLHKMTNPHREGYFHIIGTAIQGAYVDRSDTDYRAIDRGEITVTPLHCNLTHYGALKKLRKAFR